MSIAPRTPVPTSRPAAGSRLVTHLEGTVIARVGDPVKCLFVLVKGQLEIVDPKSQVQTLTRVPEVARTAQVEAIDRGRWTANIIARSEVAVMPLDFVSMHALMERVKKDADLSLEQMRGRLREALRQVSLRDGRICELETANEELDAWNRDQGERRKRSEARIAELEAELAKSRNERDQEVMGATLDAVAEASRLRKENSRLASEMTELNAEAERLRTEVKVRQAEIDSWTEEVGTGGLEVVEEIPSEPISETGRPTLAEAASDPNSWADLGPAPTARAPMATIGFDDDLLSATTSLGIPAPAQQSADGDPIVTDEEGNAVPNVWAVSEWPSYRIDAPASSVTGQAIPGYSTTESEASDTAEERSERTTLLGPPPSVATPPVPPSRALTPGEPHPRRR